MPKAFCAKCGHFRKYSTSSREETINQAGLTFKTMVTKATCNRCGSDVYVRALSDENTKNKLLAFQLAEESFKVAQIIPPLENNKYRVTEYQGHVSIKGVQICLICGEAVSEYLSHPLCEECRIRARKMLYPEKYGKL